MGKNIILLKTLLRSTSGINICRNCKDKKKRGRIIGGMVGQGILFLMLMAYCIATCIGYSKFGLHDAIPTLCALTISLLSFVFTFFKSNGYLFGFREYDMLMSLPFRAKDIAACKFGYMYIKSLPWYASVSLAMLVGYAFEGNTPIAVYPVWAVLSLILPVIPMLAAAFLGYLIALLGSGFRNKNLVMTVLSMALVIACFGLRFFMEDMFRNNKVQEVLENMNSFTEDAGRIYLPVKWFSHAVNSLDITAILLLVLATVLLFELVFIPVGRSYRKINSRLGSHSSRGSFTMKEQKCRTQLSTIVFKEWKRMTGSVTYMTNAAVGVIMCIAAGIAILFVNVDDLLQKMTKGAPVTKEMLIPSIPLIVYFFVGMSATTAMSPSLEGRNHWIVQSLPISKKTLYQGKMLFNLYLTLPAALFTTLMFCIKFKVPVQTSVLFLLLITCLCCFSTAWGCVCGVKHMRLDWENEIEVVKQGAAVTIYILPNIFVTMGLIVLTIVLGRKVPAELTTIVLTVSVSVLALLSYRKVMTLSKK